MRPRRNKNVSINPKKQTTMEIVWTKNNCRINGKTYNFSYIPYGVSVDAEEKEREAFNFVIKALKYRLDNCEKQLLQHIDEANFNENGAQWNGGHFSRPVHEQVKDFVEGNPRGWLELESNPLLVQQALRALYQYPEKNELANNIVTEIALCKMCDML